MSDIDLILLGLIKSSPQSAYELQKSIEYRNISYWVKISNPSIYKNIKLLEKKEYIRGKNIKNGNMPTKKVFEITELGEAYFKESMLKISQKQVNIFLSINAVIMNLDQIEEEARIECIDSICHQITILKEYIETKEKQRQHIPEKGKLIIKQQKQLVQVLDEWMLEVKKIME